MTREEFLEKYSTLLIDSDQKRYNEAVDDLDKLDEKTWVNKYKQFFMDSDLDAGEVKSLVSSTKSLAERLKDAFGDVKFDPSSKWKATVYQQKFPEYNTPERRQELDEYLSKMKKYYDDEEKFRREEADRKKREKEVEDDWSVLAKSDTVPWYKGLARQLLASEYAKQRYIDNPQESLLGEKAPAIGEAPAMRVGATADLLAGAAGAAADALPGAPGILAGPAIRTARDIAYIASGSPYKKSLPEIFKDAGTDIGINLGANYLPNFRRQGRMGKNATKNSPVTTEMELQKMGNSINNEQVDRLYAAISSDDGIPSNYLVQMVEELPDSPMKQELLSSVNNLGEINYGEMRKTMEKWHDAAKLADRSMDSDIEIANLRSNLDLKSQHRATDDELAEWYAKRGHSQWKPNFEYPNVPGPYRDYVNKIVTADRNLSNAQRATVWMLSNMNENAGTAVAKEIAAGTGARMRSTPEMQPGQFDPEELYELDRQNSRFWDAGFEPHKNENDPLYEAFARWHERKHGFRPGDKGAKK